jgi:hypothetical protein
MEKLINLLKKIKIIGEEERMLDIYDSFPETVTRVYNSDGSLKETELYLGWKSEWNKPKQNFWITFSLDMGYLKGGNANHENEGGRIHLSEIAQRELFWYRKEYLISESSGIHDNSSAVRTNFITRRELKKAYSPYNLKAAEETKKANFK